MALHFLGGDTQDQGSPRLYQDGCDYIVQGYVVTDSQVIAKLKIPPGETVVRVPGSLWKYLPASHRMETEETGNPEHCDRAPRGTKCSVGPCSSCGRGGCHAMRPESAHVCGARELPNRAAGMSEPGCD